MKLTCAIPKMLSPEHIPCLNDALDRGINKCIPVIAPIWSKRVELIRICKYHSGYAERITVWIQAIHRRFEKFLERQVDGMFNNVFHSVSPAVSSGTLLSIDLTATCIFACLMSQPVELI